MRHHNADKWPVEWNGKTLYLSPLTADLKAAFCRWLEPRYVFSAYRMTQAPGLSDEMRRHAAKEHMLAQQLVNSGGIFWTTDPSPAVATALLTPDGTAYLTRLVLGIEDWPDADLAAFLDAKNPPRPDGETPVTDYQVAMDAAWETADPKAPTGSPPSPGPTATGGSSGGSPPGTSASVSPTPAA